MREFGEAKPVVAQEGGPQSASTRALQRLKGLLAGKRFDEARLQLGSVFPAEAKNGARLEFLLDHWPAQAAVELKDLPASNWAGASFCSALSAAALRLSDGDWAHLAAALPAEVGQQAASVRAANAAISEGRDDEARSLLQAVGLRSPLRPARQFLGGLLAFYGGKDEEALEGLSRLLQDARFGAAARTAGFVAALDAGVTDRSAFLCRAHLSSRCLDIWATRRQKLIAKLGSAQRKIDSGHRTAAMAALARELKSADDVELSTARRDVAGHLLRGSENMTGTLERFQRAFPPPSGHLMATSEVPALIEAHAGTGDAIREAVMGWLVFGGSTRRIFEHTRGAGSELIARVAAAALYRAFTVTQKDPSKPIWRDFDKALESDEPPWESSDKVEEMLEIIFGDTEVDATSVLEMSLDLDPNRADVWLAYLRLLKDASTKKHFEIALDQSIERFPDHPEILSLAASVAMDRGAFDKAQDFAARARVHAPADRAAAQLEIEALLGKARKAVQLAKTKVAREAYQAAAARFRPGSIESFLIAAEMECLALAKLALEQRLETLSRTARPEGCRPWTWLGCLALAAERLRTGETSSARKKGTKKASASRLAVPVEVQSSPPTERDLSSLLCLSLLKGFEASPAPEAFRDIVRQALGRGIPVVRELSAARSALDLLRPADRGYLEIADRCFELGDETPELLAALLEAARRAQRPDTYFEGIDALGRLDRAVKQVQGRMSKSLASPFMAVLFGQSIDVGHPDFKLFSRLRLLRSSLGPNKKRSSVSQAKKKAKKSKSAKKLGANQPASLEKPKKKTGRELSQDDQLEILF